MQYKLRRAMRKDADLIKEIHRQCEKHIGVFDLFKVWQRYLTENTKWKYVICDNKGFARYAWSKKFQSWTIYEIAVLEEFKNQGVAKFIIENLPKPMTLKCNVDNDTGNVFYKKIGMTKLGTTYTRWGKEEYVWQW